MESENSNLKKIIKSDDFLKNENQDNLEIINLNDVENFSSLMDSMGKISCKGKTSGLNFIYKDVEYNLTGYVSCPSTYNEVACYFRVNHIFVHNDSLYTKIGPKKSKVPIENLGEYLESLISNPNKYRSDENKLKTAIITLNIDDEYPISITKKVLSRIYNEFNKIEKQHEEGFLEYHILYEGYNFLDIPPPPPPTK